MEWLVRTTEDYLFPSISPVEEKRSTLSNSQCRRIHNLMKAWGDRKTPEAPLIVDKLFQYLQKHAPSSITTFSYNLRMETWATCGGTRDAQAVSQCTHLLELLKSHNCLSPNVHSYNACIKAWIRSAKPDNVDQIELLIEDMQKTANMTGDVMVVPNRRSYNLLLYGLSNSNKTSTAATRALQIVEYLKHCSEPFLQPNGNTFGLLILCLVRDDQTNGFEDRLEASFTNCLRFSREHDIEIEADTFNFYISGWLRVRRPDSLKHIKASLLTMENLFGRGHTVCKPNRVTMNTVLAAHVRFLDGDNLDSILGLHKRLESTYSLTSDTTTLNTLIDAHAKSRRATADMSALSLLEIMERNLIHGHSSKHPKPDAYTYCAVIDCLAKTNPRKAGTESEQILRRMIDFHTRYGGPRPTIAVFNSVLNALAVSLPSNLTAVQAILSEMEGRNAEESLAPAPDIISYNSAFKAALQSRSVHGAQWANEVLRSLESKVQDGEKSLIPDSSSYTTVIAAYGRSEHPQKVQKARDLVDRALMMYHGGYMVHPPGISVFNAACNACCFVGGNVQEKESVFSSMMDIYNKIPGSTRPDETTYGTLLRGCSQLLHQGQSTKQQEYAKRFFRKACDAGVCGNFVLRQIKFAAQAETYRDLLGCEIGANCTMADLPASWSRNVKSMKVKN